MLLLVQRVYLTPKIASATGYSRFGLPINTARFSVFTPSYHDIFRHIDPEVQKLKRK